MRRINYSEKSPIRRRKGASSSLLDDDRIRMIDRGDWKTRAILSRFSDLEDLSLVRLPRLLAALLSRKEFNQTLRIDSIRTKLNRIACTGRGENFSRRIKRHPHEIFDEFERK
jgi:hypothetical protein